VADFPVPIRSGDRLDYFRIADNSSSTQFRPSLVGVETHFVPIRVKEISVIPCGNIPDAAAILYCCSPVLGDEVKDSSHIIHFERSRFREVRR
jgi:hypothetical protein